jgi:aminopeptidase N
MTARAASLRPWAGALLLAGLALALGWQARRAGAPSGVSGGRLRPAEAAYDVRRYDLALTVFPAERRIAGRNRVTVEARAPLDRFELDLVDRFAVRSASVDGAPSSVRHAGGRVEVELRAPWRAGERHAVEIAYDGRPRVAPNAPWDGGFVWAKSRDGSPWVAVAVQDPGADEWWPAKDHPGDEPDEGLSIELTVPAGLVGLATGRKVAETRGAGTTTTRWESSFPVNNYAVTINVGPYLPVEEIYHGIDGAQSAPIVFWALPEDVERARVLWRQAPRMLEVLGRRFGEYPFLADKYAVAQSPHLGMEHQTLVAYGARFRDNPYGFDWLLMHETAHEWWGNAVTVRDWADFWIHEGFATYSEAVFVNDTLGVEKYLAYMRRLRRGVRNRLPIVRGRDLDTVAAYHGDIYGKGACVLHTLRWLLGDDAFLPSSIASRPTRAIATG